jgi:hypothetical protein
MNVHMRPTVTPEAEETLEDLADSLAIPESRYEQAERSYKSLGDWLNRPDSTIRQFDPQVHVQGSFGLGTVIPPISDEEHYDIDAVSEFRKLTKSQTTQQQLKQLLGHEMKLYARRQSMNMPVEEHRRCWRLEYAEGAQFHMDVTPGLLNAAEQRALLLSRGLDATSSVVQFVILEPCGHRWRRFGRPWYRYGNDAGGTAGDLSAQHVPCFAGRPTHDVAGTNLNGHACCVNESRMRKRGSERPTTRGTIQSTQVARTVIATVGMQRRDRGVGGLSLTINHEGARQPLLRRKQSPIFPPTAYSNTDLRRAAAGTTSSYS